MQPHTLTKTTIINQPLEKVFAFFSNAENLNLLTPEELHFKILTPTPIAMYQGANIDYTIRLMGIPFKWKTEITEWNPPYGFADKQLKGPYLIWHHTHSFERINDLQTKMTDRIEYLSPGWIFEPIIQKLFIQKKVEEIFEYREKMLASYLS